MPLELMDLFGDVLRPLKNDRRAHSLAVGRKVEAEAGRVRPSLRADLVAAAVLHDIGYAHPDTGLHAVDGARFLAAEDFSPAVCNLVAHHTASTYEASERGVDLTVYQAFRVDQDLGEAHAVLWWADLTTGPRGQDVRVEDRLAEISSRYGPGDAVSRFIERARLVLLSAGQSPAGSIQVPC